MFHRFHDLKGGPGPQDPEMINNRSSSISHGGSMGAVIYNSLLCSEDDLRASQLGNQGQGSQLENANQQQQQQQQQHPIPTQSPGPPDYASHEESLTAQRQNVLTNGQKIGSGTQGSPYLLENYQRLSTNDPPQHFASFNNICEGKVSSHSIQYQLSVEDQRNNAALHREVTDLQRTSAGHSNEHQLDKDSYSLYSQNFPKQQVQKTQIQSTHYSEHQLLHSPRLQVNSPKYLDDQKDKHEYQNNTEVQMISESIKPQSNSQISLKESENQIAAIQKLSVGSRAHIQKPNDSRKSMNSRNQVETQGNTGALSERSSDDHIINDVVSNKHVDCNLPARYLPTPSIRPILKQELDGYNNYEKRVYDRRLQDGGKKDLKNQMANSSHQAAEPTLHGYKTMTKMYSGEADNVLKRGALDGVHARQLESYKSFETTPNVGSHENVCDNESPTYNREVFSRNGEEDVDMIHSSIYTSPIVSKGRLPKQHICPICKMSFKNGTQLKNHAWRHTGEKPFSCETCHATFTQHSNLKTHMRIHTGERPYACLECNATFTQISNLRTHQKIHTGDKPFECDECGIKFSQQSNLKSHKLIHTGERPFQCVHCDASFVQSTHLRNHQRIHSDERPYPCEQCGAKFRQLSNLKTHEKIHTGERPYVCPNCGSSFAQKSNLKSHIFKLHAPDGSSPSRRGRKKKLEPIKPHYCNICGAKFTLISNLKIHSRLHTGEKPYSCTTCNASFAQKSNLKSHEMTHTCMKPYQCDECEAAFRQKTNLRTHKLKKHSSVKSSRLKDFSENRYNTNALLNDTDHSPYNTSHF